MFRSTLRFVPAALLAAALTGCQWYSSAWHAQHAREFGDAAPKRQPKEEPQVVLQSATAAPDSTPVPEPKPVAESKPEPKTEPRTEPRLKLKTEPKPADTVSALDRVEAERRAEEEAQAARDSIEREKQELEALERERAESEKAARPKIEVRRGGSHTSGDGSALGLYLMSNDVAVSYSKLAFTMSDDPEIKAFARRMLNDHGQMLVVARALVTEGEIAPSDNRLALELRGESVEQRDSLRVLTGRAFDNAYIANEIAYHERLLTLLDEELLAHARNDQLRELIETMRPVISAHLAHAEQLQGKSRRSR
jgi:putative membrane protein